MDASDCRPASAAASIVAGKPATRRALVALTNRAPWAGGIVRWTCRSDAFNGRVEAVVAIPARDERARIEACLEACAHAAALSGLRVRLVVLVNGTRDDTAERALAWSVRRRRPITLVDVDFAPPLAHAGAARRLALEIASLDVPPDTMLMTTDADARPEPAWVATNAARLNEGVALVCGRVALDPDEASRLSARIEAVGEIEGRYKRATLELEHRLDPDPWNPWPHHGMASGASLAIRVRDLRAIGGVPLVPCGEDRTLARVARARGLPVVHADEVVVEVSCRLRGRAAGGMADALRQRLHDPDPPCDEALEPAAVLRARVLARARARRLWPSRDARRDALTSGGADDALAAALSREDAFECAWAHLEQAVHARSRVRLRTGDLCRELPALLALLDDAREPGRSATAATASRFPVSIRSRLPFVPPRTEPKRLPAPIDGDGV